MLTRSFYKVSEVAAALEVSTRTVYRMLESGELEHLKIGGSRKITEEQFQNFLEKCADAGKKSA